LPSSTRLLKINLMSRLAQQVIIVLIPPLALIFLVLGTIFLGIATPDRRRRHGCGRRA
jgi:TRAP-type mannitol/chloroaromatic compound transport system permease large subunit